METITGQTEMKSDALVEYFKPLTEWLEKQNENETIGWDRAHRWYPQGDFKYRTLFSLSVIP